MKVNMEKITEYGTRIRSAVLMLSALMQDNSLIPKINNTPISLMELYTYFNLDKIGFKVLMNELLKHRLIAYIVCDKLETVILNPALFLDCESTELTNMLTDNIFSQSNVILLADHDDDSFSITKKIRGNIRNAIRSLN